jgi:3-hydroxyisobutyrate dehydrogenase-like beta-hydroxyacid dehydrogenase
MQRIGFVGVGVMGHGMASRLLNAGYPLTIVAHRNRTPVDDLVSRGAREAAKYAELVEASDSIFLCVSNSTVVESVIGQLEPFLRRGMTIVDTGTSSPVSTRALHERLAKIGVMFVEAPVTGGVKQAAAGELGALVGADEDTFDVVKPLLQVMCRTVHHFGPPGTGNTAKLLNNFMVFGIAALVTEAFSRADHAGVDWEKLYEVVVCGSADSGVLRRIIGSATKGDFKGYVFDVDGSLKDVRYFCELAESMGGLTPLDSAVRDVYEKAVADGHGKRLLSELLAPDVRGG